jgi:hypothetical protein
MDKKEKLKASIYKYISKKIDAAENVDYFEIEIICHDGTLQREFRDKEREKVY